MLSTPLILFESPFSRAAAFVLPPWHVNGPAEFHKIQWSIEGSMAWSWAIIGHPPGAQVVLRLRLR